MDLLDLTDSLKRALAVPGEFDAFFPDTTDSDLAGMIGDAIAEAQLDGFLHTTGMDLSLGTVTPDLSFAQQALAILYARARVLQARIANLKNHTRYKAGIVEAEVEQSASVLVELLKETQARKTQLLDDAKGGTAGASFSMIDLYIAKSIDWGTSDVAYVRIPSMYAGTDGRF